MVISLETADIQPFLHTHHAHQNGNLPMFKKTQMKFKYYANAKINVCLKLDYEYKPLFVITVNQLIKIETV